MSERQSSDFFGKFLETLERPSDPMSATAERIVEALETHGGSMGLIELQRSSGRPYEEFTRAILKLEEKGFVEVQGESGEERVILRRHEATAG